MSWPGLCRQQSHFGPKLDGTGSQPGGAWHNAACLELVSGFARYCRLFAGFLSNLYHLLCIASQDFIYDFVWCLNAATNVTISCFSFDVWSQWNEAFRVQPAGSTACWCPRVRYRVEAEHSDSGEQDCKERSSVSAVSNHTQSVCER